MVNETIQSTDMTQIDKVKASTNQESIIKFLKRKQKIYIHYNV